MSTIPLTEREQRAWDKVNAYREQHADMTVSATLTALGLGPNDSAAYYSAKRKLVGKSNRRTIWVGEDDPEPEQVTEADALKTVIETLDGFEPQYQRRIIRTAMAFHRIDLGDEG